MTNTHLIFGRHAGLAAVWLVLFACTAAVPAVGQASSQLGKKELKALSASPAGQERLAAYYRDKAQHLRARAEEFSKEADYLATQPATVESKQGISCNCTSHYRYFSKLYAQEAKDAETLAAKYRQLAQDSQSKTTQL
jgi:septal ring factor EnvC (AmiA/AmiB activator)